MIGLFAVSNAKFVSTDHRCGNALFANQDGAGTWEAFDMIEVGDNKVAFKDYISKKIRESRMLTEDIGGRITLQMKCQLT